MAPTQEGSNVRVFFRCKESLNQHTNAEKVGESHKVPREGDEIAELVKDSEVGVDTAWGVLVQWSS